MQEQKPSTLTVIRYQLSRPSVMNWSYPIMVSSVMTAMIFAVRCLCTFTGFPIPATSVIGNAALNILVTLLALVLPAALLSNGLSDRIVGRFTGAGSLILAFCSGIPLMLITTATYNLSAWVILRFGTKMPFPFLFTDYATSSAAGEVLSVMSDTVLPAAGASLFFFGLMWSRFRSKERFAGYAIIAFAYMMFSLDAVSALGLLITGWWCCFLRTKTDNIAGPFVCLVAARLSQYLFTGTLGKVDILSIQTYSDIDSVFFYSSLPAAFMGLVLLSFFMKTLNSFYDSFTDDEEDSRYDNSIPAFDKGINLTIIVSGAIFFTLWILMLKGVHL